MEDQNNNVKTNYVKMIIMLIVIFLLGFFTIWFTSKGDLNNAISLFKDISWSFLGVILIGWLIWVFTDLIIWFYLCKIVKSDYKFKQAFNVFFIGKLFNALTPFAAGGQVMQLFVFRKQGIKANDALAILLFQYAIYMVMVISIGAIGLLIFNNQFNEMFANTPLFSSLTIISFIFNIIIIITMLLLVSSKWAQKWASKIVGKISKMIPFMKKDLSEGIEKTVENMHDAGGKFLSKKRRLFGFLLLDAGTILGAGIIGLFSIKALGVDISFNYIGQMTSTMTIPTVLGGLIPMPGGAGVTELSTFAIFEGFIKHTNPLTTNIHTLATSAALLFRIVTFYLTIVVGFIVFLQASETQSLWKEKNNGK